MFNYIENLKSKPDHIKKRFAFTVSATISGLILVGWIASYGISSKPTIADNADAPVSSLTAKKASG